MGTKEIVEIKDKEERRRLCEFVFYFFKDNSDRYPERDLTRANGLWLAFRK